MTDREPVEVTNLDRFGSPPLPWSRPHDLLAASPSEPGTSYFLGTPRPDGRPHAAGVGAAWLDGDLSFTSGPGTRKARNLAANPVCTFSVGLESIDLILEGEAARVTDLATLERVARLYREGGWPAEVEGDALALRTLRGAAGTRRLMSSTTLPPGLWCRAQANSSPSNAGSMAMGAGR